jgi:hypothetical protein
MQTERKKNGRDYSMPQGSVIFITEKLVGWWRKPDYPEKTTDRSQVEKKTFIIVAFNIL